MPDNKKTETAVYLQQVKTAAATQMRLLSGALESARDMGDRADAALARGVRYDDVREMQRANAVLFTTWQVCREQSQAADRPLARLRQSTWQVPEFTRDEAHVLLDTPENTKPWEGYDSDPEDDPKSTELGWIRLRKSAEAKLAEIVEMGQ